MFASATTNLGTITKTLRRTMDQITTIIMGRQNPSTQVYSMIATVSATVDWFVALNATRQ